MTNNFVRWCARIALVVCVLPGQSNAQSADICTKLACSGPLAVGMSPVALTNYGERGDQGRGGDIIARTVEELLPNYIVRGLERGLERPIRIVQNFDPTKFKGADGLDLAAIITPTVSNAGIAGVRASTKVSVRVGPAVFEDTEVLLISQRTDFGELEVRMTDHGIAIAKRITVLSFNERTVQNQRLPRGLIQFFCVQPENPDDRQLQLLARQLTLELPHYLTEAGRQQKLEIFVRGLEYGESIATCESRNYKGSMYQQQQVPNQRVQNQGWDGSLELDRKNPRKGLLTIRASDPFSGSNYRRLTQVPVEDVTRPAMRQIAEQVVADLIKQFGPPQ